MSESGEWYLDTRNGQVVSAEDAPRAVDRLGPYATREEAARAYEIAAEKTKAWDEDPDWNDGPDQDGSAQQE